MIEIYNKKPKDNAYEVYRPNFPRQLPRISDFSDSPRPRQFPRSSLLLLLHSTGIPQSSLRTYLQTFAIMAAPTRASRIRKTPPNINAMEVTNTEPGNPALLYAEHLASNKDSIKTKTDKISLRQHLRHPRQIPQWNLRVPQTVRIPHPNPN